MFGLGLGISLRQAPTLEIRLENQCVVCGLNIEDDESRKSAIAANIEHPKKYDFCTGCGNHVAFDRSHGYKCRWTRRAKKRLRAIEKNGLLNREINLRGITHMDAVTFIQQALVVLYNRGEVSF